MHYLCLIILIQKQIVYSIIYNKLIAYIIIIIRNKDEFLNKINIKAINKNYVCIL